MTESHVAGAQNDALRSTSKGETTRLTLKARRIGEPDTYPGKRRWIRYDAGMRLDVTTDPGNPSKLQAAIMHNASSGGISFWLKRQLYDGTTVFVREFRTDNRPTDWIEARVRHSTFGLRGYLVGAEFKDPEPPGDNGAVCSNEIPEEEATADVAESVGTDPPPAREAHRGVWGWLKRSRTD